MNIHFKVKNNSQHLILFVHGLQGSKETFYTEEDKLFFHEYLEQPILNHVDIGYLEYHTEDILSKKSFAFILSKIFLPFKNNPINNLNIEELSASASHRIEEVISQYESVNFICHSMGGLVVKGVLIENENIQDKTIFYITLATPHRGSNKAKYLNGINRQVKSLEENSQIIDYLTNKYFNIKNKFNRHYYRATDESWVLPKENAFPISEHMHTSPVDSNHSDIAKPRFNVYLSPFIYDINKKIKDYLSLNKIILKELYSIDTKTLKELYIIDTKIIKISKSLYTRGIQCPKALWLKKQKNSVLTIPDASAEAIFETGNIVGDLACELFPNGERIAFEKDYKKMLYTTKQYIEEGVLNIYEATFSYDGILVMVDIFHIDADGVSIYEVKSSTSVKDIYIHDVSIQYYVLKHLGFNVKSVNIVHLDSSYIRGDELNISELFSVVDVSQEVQSLQANIPHILEEFENYLSDKTNEPDIDIGKQCKNPYECDALHYCWRVQRGIPEYSVFNIFNLGSKKQVELYEQGIVDIKDVPDSFDMTAKQSQAVSNYKSGVTHINKVAIEEFLSTLTHPVYHLDFETFQQPIPEFKGISPFMQIPFQYSLHIEHEDGRLEHREFLASDGIDPREHLARKLCQDIPRDVTVLAYNMGFEKGVIRKLASTYPELSELLLSIHDNIKDLMTPFQQKHYVTPSMNGSYSIKYVLPALVPEMQDAYKELDGVQNGSQAMNAFANMSKLDADAKEKMRKSLLEYCKLDTLAMVKILNKLKKDIDE